MMEKSWKFPKPFFQDQDQDSWVSRRILYFSSSRRLETKTLVSRTTSLLRATYTTVPWFDSIHLVNLFESIRFLKKPGPFNSTTTCWGVCKMQSLPPLTVCNFCAGIAHLVLFHNSLRTATLLITAVDTNTHRHCRHSHLSVSFILLSIYQSTLLYRRAFAVAQLSWPDSWIESDKTIWIEFLAWVESNKVIFWWIGMH